jgi:hypothetical protein
MKDLVLGKILVTFLAFAPVSVFAASNDWVYLCKPTEFLNTENISALVIFKHSGGASFMVKYTQPCGDSLVVHHASMHGSAYGGMISGPYWGFQPSDRSRIRVEHSKKGITATALGDGDLKYERVFDCVVSPSFPW